MEATVSNTTVATTKDPKVQTGPVAQVASPSGGTFRGLGVVLRRELSSYFSTAVAYVFLAIFLVVSSWMLWFMGGLYENNQADLRGFFETMPFVYLVLIPALSMRMWAEERRGGTIELLLTLPISTGAAVLGKFLAAWIFVAVGLALTTTHWVSVAYLGEPDNGVIFACYVANLLLAGAYLAIGSYMSALTKNQVIAFVLTFAACLFLYLLSFIPLVGSVDLASGDFSKRSLLITILGGIKDLGIREHFQSIVRGVLELRDIVYFLSLTALGLFATGVAIEKRKGA